MALLWWAVRKGQRQSQERHDLHPTTTVADRWSTTLATDRQLDYIESLLDSTGLTLSAATRDTLGRSVSVDGLSIGEASDLIGLPERTTRGPPGGRYAPTRG